MSKPLPLSDFRALRRVLEEHEFATGGEDVPPSDLIKPEIWSGIMHLPDDVAIKISNHEGARLELLYSLWGDWIQAVGNPLNPDNLFAGMLDAADCFQCTTFDLLHGFYRSALANLRSGLELVAAGAYGNLRPSDPQYVAWTKGGARLSFSGWRNHLHAVVSEETQWFLKKDSWPDQLYSDLCRYTHSRPGASDGTLWESNGPVYNGAAIELTFKMSLSTYAVGYLLTKLGRSNSRLADSSRILFELDWMPGHGELRKAFDQLYSEA